MCPLTTFTPGGDADAAQVMNNFNLCVLTDTAKTVDAVHNFVNGLLLGGDSVISEGSNANGRWVRFAGGLQVCYGTKDLGAFTTNNAQGATFVNGPHTVTFPAAFIAAPEYFAAFMRTDNILWCCGNSAVAGSGAFYVAAPLNATFGTDACYLAIGRWK